jgi:hypothetical protein
VLEDRVVPSVTGSEFRVNPSVAGDQFDADVASNASGQSVVVWREGDTGEIMARVYAPGDGWGDEIVVRGLGIHGPGSEPSVAMDDDGFFVVAWTDTLFFAGETFQSVWARQYFSGGLPRTDAFVVADHPDRADYAPDVAVDPSGTGIGNFVVSYTQDYSATDKDVRVVRFLDGATAPISGSDVRIGTSNGDEVENKSSVAVDDDGNYSVAYQDATFAAPSNTNIRLARYTSSGTRLQDVQIAGASFKESNPSVAMDDAGNTVVAWQQQNPTSAGGWNIRAKRVSASGSLGSTIQIASTSASETLPAVAVQRSTGDYVVAFQSKSGSNAARVKVSERRATGTDAGLHDLGSARTRPAVGIDGLGNYLVTFQASDTSENGIYGRRGVLD